MKTSKSAGDINIAIHPKNLSELESVLRGGRDFYASLSASMADAILGAWNVGNRRIDQVRVAALKRDQEAGIWLSGEPIGFGVSADGRVQLGDGQHRLLAQVQSGTEQIYHCRVFTDENEFETFVSTRDSGKPRSLGDLLTILQVTEGSGAAQAFERVCNAMQSFTGATPSRLSRQERLAFAFAHAAEIGWALTLPRRQFRSHVLAALALAYGKHKRLVGDFVAQVISGAELPSGSPALELLKALPGLNDARGSIAKDRAMGTVMRVVHDGIRGRKKTAVRKSQAGASPMRAAVAEFAGATVASAWSARHGRRAAK